MRRDEAGPSSDRGEAPLRLIALRDVETAERWRDSLVAAGLQAMIVLEDAMEAVPGASVLPGWLPPSPPIVHSIFVPAGEAEAARAVLVDAGWDGRRTGFGATRGRIDPRVVVAGAVAALLLALAAAWAAAALGGP